MDQPPEPVQDNTGEEARAPAPLPEPYPPKYTRTVKKSGVWVKSLFSLAAYLLIGYYIFPGYTILLLITGIIMIHESGHFLAMRYFRYNELGIFFIPLLGAYVSGSKREVSQAQSAVILLAGPLPGILIGCIMYIADRNSAGLFLYDISLSRIGMIFIFLNLVNLLPVYPLDGGQLLNRVFLDEEGTWSRVFVYLSAGFLCWVAFKPHFYVLLVFPAMMMLRSLGENRMDSIEKKIEEEGINTDVDYEHLRDEDYWKIRNILVEEHPAFRDFHRTPPYIYHSREEKVMEAVQNLLHRHLVQDVSLAGKILILAIWIAAIASPWLIHMNFNWFRQLGF